MRGFGAWGYGGGMDGYLVEVEVGVEAARVWRTLVEPDQIGQWFGWDAATLGEEVEFIFFEHATRDPARMRIEFEGDAGQYLEVAAAGGNSVVRVVQPAADGAEERIQPDLLEQGWIAFLYQLRRYVESHSGESRRTLYLTGAGVAAEVAAAVDRRLPGPTWFSGEYTRVYGTGDFGPGLGVLFASAPLGSDGHDKATLTLSAWGLSDADFFELTSDWLGWWRTLVDGGEVVVDPVGGA